jgi:hypothetical protein
MQHAWERRELHAGLFVGNTEIKRTLGRSRRKWDGKVKLDLRERVYIDLSQDMDQWLALVNTLINFWLP